MPRRSLITLVGVALVACSNTSTQSELAVASSAQAAPQSAASASGWSAARSRKFELTYASTIADIPAGTKELRVWMPRPVTVDGQQEVIQSTLAPVSGAMVTEGTDKKGENHFWFVTIPNPPASVTLTATHVVNRREQVNNYFRGAGTKPLTPEQRQQMAEYLQADSLVPTTGRVEELAGAVAKDEKNSVNVARSLYDCVLGRMEYKKTGTGWGRGDTLWACDNGYGNCTDFHSMFMSFARARGVPARFHMGIPLPPERGAGAIGGYHCWAEFFVPEMGWVPVDISEADKHPELAQYYFGALTEDRVAFTKGRDLDLVPAPASGRQNFFIYPLVEADGKPLAEKHDFKYRDL